MGKGLNLSPRGGCPRNLDYQPQDLDLSSAPLLWADLAWLPDLPATCERASTRSWSVFDALPDLTLAIES
jgi:hypothetical protein